MSTGVLLMAYGTPGSRAEIEEYYTHIRRGRAPTPEQLAELTARYDKIGGSPLATITRAQVAGVADELERRHPGEFIVAQGFKHAPPFIEDGVRELHARGADTAIGLVLAPHFSTGSVGEYMNRARAASEELGGPQFGFVRSWHLAEGYLAFLHGAVEDALGELPAPSRAGAHVIFTAHSLPERIVAGTGDPYPDQLRETAEAVAARVGDIAFSTAWQSAGRTPEPWIGPDVLDRMTEVVETGASAIVVCPCGFIADHLEILFDVDVECAAEAALLDVPFARTASPNARREFVGMLADQLLAHLAAQQPA
jgi:ferrochelatase